MFSGLVMIPKVSKKRGNGQRPIRIGELPSVCRRELRREIKNGGNSLLLDVRRLQRAGFTDVRNLTGGIDAWSPSVDATVPTY